MRVAALSPTLRAISAKRPEFSHHRLRQLRDPRGVDVSEKVTLNRARAGVRRLAKSVLAMIHRIQRQFDYFKQHPLTRDRPAAAMRRFVAWQLKSRLLNPSVFHWVNDSKLLVRRGMTGATGNIYCGLHECADMAFMLHFLREGDLFGDIGANVGTYTVLASTVCGARSLAVEPEPVTVSYLQANVALNGIGSMVRVAQTAVGDTEGTVRFTVGLDTMNKVDAVATEGTFQTLPLTTMDVLFDNSLPAMLKVDVEGYEDAVFRGAQRVLASPSLLCVQSEGRGPEVTEQLTAHGFEEWHYNPFTRQLTEQPEVPHGNGLFLRNVPEVRQRLQHAPRIRVLHHTL